MLLACTAAWGVDPKAREPKPDPGVSELLDRARQLESNVPTSEDQPIQPAAEQGVALLLEDPQLGVSAFPEGGARYFGARLILINPTSDPVAVPGRQIALTCGGRRIVPQDWPSTMAAAPLRIGGQTVELSQVKVPEEVNVPAGGSASVTLLFSNLDRGPFIPALKLEVPLPDGVRTIDVNRYERARLALTSERIGPGGCLALLTVNGELNTVNAGALIGELERVAEDKVARAVIAWGDAAARPDDELQQWLQSAGTAIGFQQQSRQLPPFPASLRELHFAHVPGLAAAEGTSVYRSTDVAVNAALRSAYEAVPVDELLRNIRDGHVLARAAALRQGAARLGPEAYSRITPLTNDPSEVLRLAAIEALRQFPQPEAIEVLSRFAREGSAAESEAALKSLAGSRFPAAHQALRTLLTSPLPIRQDIVVRVLALQPRVEWTGFLRSMLDSENSEVRIEALEALARVGTEDLLACYEQALQSSDEALRNAAFEQLAGRGDARSEELATGYVLGQLERRRLTGPMIQYLRRVPDQRAVPLLLKMLDSTGDNKRAQIDLLLAIGDQSVAEMIAGRFGQLSAADQASVLRGMSQTRSASMTPLALAALTSTDAQLVTTALSALRGEESDAVVKALAETLAHSTNNAIRGPICMTLAAIGTPRARLELIAARQSTSDDVRRFAAAALSQMRQQSPANGAVELAEGQVRENKIADARKSLSIAERLDAAHPGIFVVRAELFKNTQQTDQALAALRHAIELDDQFFEAHFALGILLAELNRHEEAISSLKLAVDLNPNSESVWRLALSQAIAGDINDAIRRVESGIREFQIEQGYSVYLYNVACVYSRAAERISRQAPADPRVERYKSDAIRHLEESLRRGVAQQAQTTAPDMYAHMRQDADLVILREDARFRKLARFDGDPADQPQAPPAANPTQPAAF